MNLSDITELVIQPACAALDAATEPALLQVLGTGLAESGFREIRQQGGGPALGPFQMEPATHDDIWTNFIGFRGTLSDKLADAGDLSTVGTGIAEVMAWNWRYAAAMCRVHYLRVKDPIPATLEEQAVQAIVPVHLFGGAGTGWGRLLELANRHQIPVIEDACQAHGARFSGRALGSFGRAAAFSFYPTKNLGALGDAGLVATADEGLAARVRSLRAGAQGKRHHHLAQGWNSRLDEIQAAVLRERLPALPEGNRTRAAVARRYRELLDGLPLRFVTPGPGVAGSSHLFVIRTARPDALRAHLGGAGIDALVHYPAALTEQPAFSDALVAGRSCPEAEAAAREVLSLPLYPGLSEREVERVAATVRAFFGGQRAGGAVSE